ncbi:PREDICTED: tubulin polymerization-promoting protein family member 2-like [Priapulus caudatus]|uniref:Tubulin polymerization-promoting protein family member 2-like n=1 Tax=Priapulus caudatus TaxID=37621 RepID=A0ABM1ECM8_PRICU|nr:PREDICTED: tubulin polymerization-promoting protein family member 2-like [Priapulus caudatus]
MAEGESQGTPTLAGNFKAFAMFGDSKSVGKTMTSKNFDKWLKDAKVVDGKKIPSTTTDIAFVKILGKKPKGTKVIEFKDLAAVLDEIAAHASKADAKKKGVPEDDAKQELLGQMKKKLSSCNHPGLKGTTSASKKGGVDRLTDTSKYTGSHKERFDAEGKGKGKVGRKDIDSGSGYVSNYKGEGTFDEKVAGD